MTGKMWGALGLDRFRSERSWDEYFYQLAAARLRYVVLNVYSLHRYQ